MAREPKSPRRGGSPRGPEEPDASALTGDALKQAAREAVARTARTGRKDEPELDAGEERDAAAAPTEPVGDGTAKPAKPQRAKAAAKRPAKPPAKARSKAGGAQSGKARARPAAGSRGRRKTSGPAQGAEAKPSPAAKPARESARTTTADKPASAVAARGHGGGDVSVVMAVDAVAREAERIARDAPRTADLDRLVDGEAVVRIDSLRAGYGQMEVIHGLSLRVGAGQSLCLIGPNGAGKSTVLHAIFGFSRIMAGSVWANGRDVTRMSPSDKLKSAGIAYVLQDNSVFPDMTVEENLWLGGYLKASPAAAREAAESVLERYPRLAERRHQPARVLSGGERRLLEISRALVMDPKVLLVDEPSIGLEPRYIDMVFEILADLQQREGRTIIMVEQNAKKGLEFADIGYVLTAGVLARAGAGDELLADADIVRLFLGG